MKRRLFISTLSLAAFVLGPSSCATGADLQADPAIAAEIARIKAFDNHAHPLRVTAEGEEDFESEGLAAAQEPLLEFPLPAEREAPNNPLKNGGIWL